MEADDALGRPYLYAVTRREDEVVVRPRMYQERVWGGLPGEREESVIVIFHVFVSLRAYLHNDV